MALRVAIANGNWSNPAIWNDGVLPRVGDMIASNSFTVTIDQDINVDSLTNAVASPVILTAQMSNYAIPSGIVTESSTYGGSYEGWRAFDRHISDWLTSSGNMTGWVTYELPSPKVVGKYVLTAIGNGAPTSIARDWTLEGWTGSTWVILHTVTGNTGNYTSPALSNTTAYIKYRINITANNGNGSYTGIKELYLYEPNEYAANSLAGGGFVLNSGITATLTSTTGGIVAGAINCVTYSAASGTSTINGIVRGSSTNGSVYGINYTGAANLNINGALTSGPTGNTYSIPVVKSGTGTLTIVGNVTGNSGTNAGFALYNSGTGTINITGNVYAVTSSGYGHGIQNIANCTINITGNIYGGNVNSGNSIGLYNQSISTINVVGNVYSSIVNSGLYTNSAGYLSIIGSLIADNGLPAVNSDSSLAINIFSGPFISSTYGFVPYRCIRMHLIPSVGNYFEFRDETTNGAVSPGAIAPATRLISPASLVDTLAVNNVRFGIVYALGALTGTLRMPTATQVTSGIPVDNTFGSAVLTVDAIWNYLVTNINTPDSIGMRLKNVSTPQTTGEQLEAFLRLD